MMLCVQDACRINDLKLLKAPVVVTSLTLDSYLTGMTHTPISSLAKELPLVGHTQINSLECIHSNSR